MTEARTESSPNFKDKTKSFFKNLTFYKDLNSLFYYFIFLVLIGFIFFAVSLIDNNFTTPFSGDYVSQQYAFYLNAYDDWKEFFRTGKFNYYDFNTYLGANNLASNCFYSLTDPFFFIVLLFPRSWIGQVMAVSTIFRMSLAGLAMYGYLRYMGTSKFSSKIAGLAYAYCGWTAWYLWFNCYTENAITFILIIWGVEKIIKEKKPWLLMGSLFLQGLVNYFFLVTFVMLGFIYAMWRFFQRIKYHSVKENFAILGIGFVGFLAGILMACLIALPSIMAVMDSPRVESSTYLDSLISALQAGDFGTFFNYLFSWENVDNGNTARTYYPIIDFFYPAMSNRGTPLTVYGNETYDNVAGSTFSYYPFIILLVPAIIHDIRKKNFWPLAGAILLTISLFTPFTYYLFHGFTQPYSRWTIIVTFAVIAYVGMFLDKLKDEPKWEIFIGGAFALCGAIVAAVLANKIVTEIESFSERVPISTVCIIACVYIVILTLVFYFKYEWKHLKTFILGCVSVEAVLMGAMVIVGHGTTDYINDANYGYALNESLSKVSKQVNANDDSYFRAWSSLEGDNNKNAGERNDYNSTSFFHSVYNYEVTDFIYWSGLMTSKTGWSGRYTTKRAGLDKFLGIKYYYVEKSDYEGNSLLDGYSNYQVNTPFDFEDISDQYENDDFYVYQDTRHINFAFSTDTIYSYDVDATTNPLETSGSSSLDVSWSILNNDEMFLKGAVLGSDVVEEIVSQYNDFNVEDAYTAYEGIESGKMSATQIYKRNNSSYPCTASYYEMSSVAKNMTVKEIVNEINNSDPIEYSGIGNTSLTYVMTISIPEDYYDETGMVFYINANFTSNRKEDIYLIGEDDELITWDNHNDDRVSNSSSRFGPRGFYVKPDPETGVAPRVKYILIVPRWSSFNSRSDVFYESYTSYKARVDNALEYAVENVNFDTDHFDFTTNYDTHRMVVTQIAYDDGWSVTATLSDGTTKELETYKIDGGFVGFIAETGEVYYSMDYTTPYYKEGRILFVIGSSMFIATYFGYIYVDMTVLKKKKLLISL